jgi:hypothetical protein
LLWISHDVFILSRWDNKDMKKSIMLRASLITVVALIFALNGFGQTKVARADGWTPLSQAGSRSWVSLATSADGSKIAAVTQYSGSVFLSSDNGLSWNQVNITPEARFNSVAMSADGTVLAVADISGFVYLSIDAGKTWKADQNAGSRGWFFVALSSDGTKYMAITNDNYIYISRPFSVIGFISNDKIGWAVTTSADGTKLAIAGSKPNGDYIYTSADSGATWTAQLGSGKHAWYAVSSSADGMKIFAADAGLNSSGVINGTGYLYLSKDRGSTWTQLTSGGQHFWTSISASADGSVITAGDFNGYTYVSRDSGNTWNQQVNLGSSGAWIVNTSGDGSKLTVAHYTGLIYRNIPSCPWTPETTLGKHNWTSITSSADGGFLAATTDSLPDPTNSVFSGTIFTANGKCGTGWSWTPQYTAGQRFWMSITSSFDGTKLLAGASGSVGTYSDSDHHLFTSSNGGISWTDQANPGINEWKAVASSVDGGRLIAAGDYLYTSIDRGNTWTKQVSAGRHYWYAVASSIDGMKLVAADYGAYGSTVGGYVYYSIDGGNTWNKMTDFPKALWTGTAISPDGKSIAAVPSGGGLMAINVDFSGVFIWLGPRKWTSVAYTYNPNNNPVINYVATAMNDYIYINNVPQLAAGSRNWSSVATTPDGSSLAATDYGGYVYTYNTGQGTSGTGPNFISMGPSSGGSGTAVSISGYRMDGNTFVVFKAANGNTYVVKATQSSPTSYNFTIPSMLPGGTYSVTAYNEYGASAAQTFTVTTPPTVTLSASPVNTVSGGNVVLTWTSSGATQCTGSVSPYLPMPQTWTSPVLNGSASVPVTATMITPYNFTLTCTGPGGSASASVSVMVSPNSNPNPNPSPSPTASPSASPTASPSSTVSPSTSPKAFNWGSNNRASIWYMFADLFR